MVSGIIRSGQMWVLSGYGGPNRGRLINDRFQSYSKVFVRWTTHRWVVKGDPGLSIKDLRMARFCDEIAVSVGRRKLTQDEREGFDTLGKKLLERVESGIDDRGATA